MGHRLQVFKALVVVVLFLLSFSSVLAAEERWESGMRSLENFICQDHGVSKLTITGAVTISHPSEPGYQVPPSQGRTILIKCDVIEFLEGSRLESVSNFRIIANLRLDGAVHVKSLRGRPGLDAAPDRELQKTRKAANGVRGGDGPGGHNAGTLGSDGTPGQRGEDGSDGATGQAGVEGPAGSPGFDGSHIHIAAFSVGNGATVTLETTGGTGGNGWRGGRGQDGGDGGVGGMGGKGGDASVTHDAEKGGDGGNGGDGGDGSNGGPGGTGGSGGRGGDVFFYVAEGGGRLVNLTMITDGGNGGYPGIGGPPGKGGKGGKFGPAGGGGWPEDVDLLCPLTFCLNRVVLEIVLDNGDALEIEWHEHGDLGQRGNYGEPGKDGLPGPIGIWGKNGSSGQAGTWNPGTVRVKDFEEYSSLHSGG